MKKLSALFLFLASSAGVLFGAITDVTITPSVPYVCNDFTIKANIRVAYDIQKVTLNYRVRYTPSIFLSVEMTRCDETDPDVFCGTIPAAAVRTEGLEWYIVAKDVNGSLLHYATPESPNILNTNPYIPNNPGTNTMQMRFKRENLLFDCVPLKAGLKLQIYHKSSCGDEQLNQSYIVSDDEEDIVLTLFGDSDPTDGYKDGFNEGEKLIIKVIEGWIDYLSRDNSIVYSSGADILDDTSLVITEVPGIEITGNGIPISNGATTPLTTDGTDFGKTFAPVSHTFTIENTKCGNLHISSSYVNNENFTINGMPIYGELTLPGETKNFTITYNAIETASTEIRIYTNALGDYLYTFVVSGEKDEKETSVTYPVSEKQPVISVSNKTIIIENTIEPISIYNVMGNLITQGTGSKFTMPQSGMYVVKTGNVTKKVVVN